MKEFIPPARRGPEFHVIEIRGKLDILSINSK